jgi:hypothetical protein
MEYGVIKYREGEITARNLSAQQQRVMESCAVALARMKYDRRIVFSHLTALQLLGVELPKFDPLKVPTRSGRYLDSEHLHACTQVKSRRYWSTGMRWHYSARDLEAVLVADKFWCVSPVIAWEQMSLWISQKEIIVLGDSMMRRNPRLRRMSLAKVERKLAAGDSFHGREGCLRALPFMRENTDSSQETRLRLKMEEFGFKEAVVNLEMADPYSGKTYYFDIAYPDLHIVLEYHGWQHGEFHQRKVDVDKRRFLNRLGWEMFEVFSDDLLDVDKFNALLASIVARVGMPRPLGTHL